MTENNYRIKYINNFIVQALATVTGLLSLFLVVPFLSGDKTLYGIYSVCISLTIFFNYADLGFQTAGQKFAGEYYACGDKESEIKVVGFTTWILLAFSTVICFFLFPLVLSPELLISDIGENAVIARSLIIILILTSPFSIIKRACSIVFNIRIEQYIYYSIVLISQIVKLISVLFFFKSGNYNLIQYYLFIQLVDVVSTIALLCYIYSKYQYGLVFIKNIKWSNDVWRLVKSIAKASLFNTITWVLFYELDLIVLSAVSSPDVVAIYNTAFTLLTLARNYFGIIYASFAARYNHFVGMKEYGSLREFYQNNVENLFPIVFFPTLILIFFSSPFVCSWVGFGYKESVLLTKYLFFGTALSFLSYPSNQYLVATNNIRSIYVMSAMLPIIFWIGIVVTYGLIGVVSFAIFKGLAQIFSATYSYFVSCIKQNIHPLVPIENILKRFWKSTIICVIMCVFLIPYANINKGIIGLSVNVLLMFVVFIVSIIVSYVDKCRLMVMCNCIRLKLKK